MRYSPRATLILACGVYLAAGTLLAGVGPALPQLAANVGQDVAALGGLFTAVAAGGVLAQFVAGPAGDRLGQGPVLAAGMLLMGGGMLGLSLSPGLTLLLLGGLMAGLGFGGVLAGGNLLVARLFAAQSAAALNGLNLFFGVGSILGPLVAGLAGGALGLPQAALWLGAGLMLLQIPLVPRYAVAAAAARAAGEGSARAALGSPPLWILGLLLLIYTGVEVGFGGWVTIYLARGADLPIEQAALLATIFWAALTCGRGLGALIGLRVRPPVLLLSCLLGVLAGTSVLWLSTGSLGPMLGGLALFGLSCGPIFPTVMALTALIGRGGATATSLVLAVGNLGGLFLPALLGLLITGRGPAAGMLLLVGGAILLLGLHLAVVVALRRAEPVRTVSYM